MLIYAHSGFLEKLPEGTKKSVDCNVMIGIIQAVTFKSTLVRCWCPAEGKSMGLRMQKGEENDKVQ